MKREAIMTATIAILSGTALAASEGSGEQTDSQSQTQSESQQSQKGQSQTTGSSEQQAQKSGNAQAQESGSGGPVISTQSQDQIRAQELMEATIITPEQEEVGSINDLILDQDGRLAGVIVGVGGYLGIGEKNVAISWDQVDYNQQEQTATVKVSKKELEEAPAFKDREEAQAQQQE